MNRQSIINGICGAITGSATVTLIMSDHPVLGILVMVALLGAIVNCLIPTEKAR